MDSIYLLVIPELDELIQNIIKDTHGQDYITTKKKAKITKKKNLKKVFPKYIYAIHLILRDIKHKRNHYAEHGTIISTNVLRGIIGERGPVTSLILEKLQEHDIIVKIKNHSFNKKRAADKFAATYKLNEDLRTIFKPESLREFTREEYGIMITKIAEHSAKCKKEAEEAEKQELEPKTMNEDLKKTNSNNTQENPQVHSDPTDQHTTQEQHPSSISLKQGLEYFRRMELKEVNKWDNTPAKVENKLYNKTIVDPRIKHDQMERLLALLQPYMESRELVLQES